MGKAAVRLRLAQDLGSRSHIEFKTILSYNCRVALRLESPTVATHVAVSLESEATFVLERSGILWLQNLLVRSLDPILPRQL
jgi:hypothetical protein